jgi:tRNA threonylcarbamoyl adenosine modification protein YeaZ
MNCLSVEFAYECRSVALSTGGQVYQVEQETGRHTPVIVLIDRVLRLAGIEREAVGRWVIGLGPGSYTGIRLAISAAQGWEMASAIECVGWSSFEGLAITASRLGHPRVTLAVDAQRQELAVATVEFPSARHQWATDIHLESFERVRKRIEAGEMVMGPGLPHLLKAGLDLRPSASDLLASVPSSASPTASRLLAPVYLRDAQFVKAPRPRDLSALELDSLTSQPR